MDFLGEGRGPWIFSLYDFENGDKTMPCKDTPQTADQ